MNPKLFQIERRLVPSPRTEAVVKVLGAAIAVVASLLMLQLSGKPALDLGREAIDQNIGGWPQIQQTLLLAVPIVMTAFAVYLCMRIKLWNIGVGGQMQIGAAAAAAVGLHVDGPAPVVLVLMMLAAAVAGAAWIVVPAVLRAFWGVNEVITTLLMAFISLKIVEYLATDAWNDPLVGVRSSELVPYTLPYLPGTVLHVGVFAPLVLGALLAFVLKRTTWGYEIDVMGANSQAADAAGMSTSRRMLAVMLWSGAIAGVTGMIQLTGSLHALSGDIGTEEGLYGFIVAALAGGSILGVLVVGVLITMLLNSGIALSTEGVSKDFVVALYGFVLLLGGLGEVASRNRLARRKRRQPPPSASTGMKPSLVEIGAKHR